MMISVIWMRGNKIKLGKDTFPLMKINSMARDSIQEFQQLQPIHAKIPMTARSLRWRPPPVG